MTQSVRPEAAGGHPPNEGSLFDRVGRALSEIESLRREWTAEPAQSARLRLGAVYARARLEKRVRGSLQPGR
jgi:hypothetical protein